MLCSKLHCQQYFELKHIFMKYEIWGSRNLDCPPSGDKTKRQTKTTNTKRSAICWWMGGHVPHDYRILALKFVQDLHAKSLRAGRAHNRPVRILPWLNTPSILALFLHELQTLKSISRFSSWESRQKWLLGGQVRHIQMFREPIARMAASFQHFTSRHS